MHSNVFSILCACELRSQTLLTYHMEKQHCLKYSCNACNLDFEKSLELEMHKIEQHETPQRSDEWNCNDCAFQASVPTELMKHLKLTSHQLSSDITEKRKVFQDYKQCYTCNLEFDG